MEKEIKSRLRAEYAKAWDGKMLTFCVGQISRAIEVGKGDLLIFEKPTIEKKFCFGESKYDEEEAAAMARYAQESEEYFKRVNLEGYDRIIAALEELSEARIYLSTRRQYPYMHRVRYFGQASPLKLWKLTFVRPCDLPDLELRGEEFRPLCGDVLGDVVAAINAERAVFEKRLNTYLKRYGMKHIRAWTYWRDA